jgi:hypothetical protein
MVLLLLLLHLRLQPFLVAHAAKARTRAIFEIVAPRAKEFRCGADNAFRASTCMA